MVRLRQSEEKNQRKGDREAAIEWWELGRQTVAEKMKRSSKITGWFQLPIKKDAGRKRKKTSLFILSLLCLILYDLFFYAKC